MLRVGVKIVHSKNTEILEVNARTNKKFTATNKKEDSDY
jgi:hypothetical protein